MATKTEELLHSLQTELTRVVSVVEGLQTQVRDAEMGKLREHIAVFNARLADLSLPVLLAQIATLQEQVAELKKWKEERERRWWQFWLGVGICSLTFTANLVMNLVLFFARKPG